MRAQVWVTTSRTRPEMERAIRSIEDTAMFTNELLKEMDHTTHRFSEDNFQERDDTAPPLRYHYRVVVGIREGKMSPGTGREFNTCWEASELPTPDLTRIGISPQGYPVSSPTAEEKQEIKRVLRHWPDNVTIALDWHY